MLEWLFKTDPKKTIAKKAVRRAKKLIHSRRAPTLNTKVDYLFWYGAVEIDPKHCVVWIIVSGPDSESIPAMLNPMRDECEAATLEAAINLPEDRLRPVEPARMIVETRVLLFPDAGYCCRVYDFINASEKSATQKAN